MFTFNNPPLGSVGDTATGLSTLSSDMDRMRKMVVRDQIILTQANHFLRSAVLLLGTLNDSANVGTGNLNLGKCT